MIKRKTSSKELGLEIALILSRYFLKSEDLHFGFFENGDGVDLYTLGRAQEAYSEFILSHLPEDGGKVLDVGCGSGNFSRKMACRGFEVDGVTPSAYLAGQARASLGEGRTVFHSRYEDLVTDRRYDLIVFSESFQYLDLDAALQKTMALLEEDGHLLICDFFRTADHSGPIKGGHPWNAFHAAIGRLPFQELKNLDITGNTAPTLDVLDQLIREIGMPVRDVLWATLLDRHPLLMKVLRWKFRKKITKWKRRYLSGAINAEALLRYKTYRLLLYRRRAAPEIEATVSSLPGSASR